MIAQNILIAGALLVLAPLVIGIIKKSKARLQGRRGFGWLQCYYDLRKFFAKDEVISQRASWVFCIAPYAYFVWIFAAAATVPLIVLQTAGVEVFLLVGLLAAARITLTLAALDVGSAFAGMGAVREMFFAVVLEPALLVVFFAKSLTVGTNLGALTAFNISAPLDLAQIMLAIAFFLLVIAESGRIPVDNPDTHLELTMVHEGMLLEYSGQRLALITWAAWLRQLIFMVIFVQVFLPTSPSLETGIVTSSVVFVIKLALTALALAVVETSTNKLRVFRVPGLIGVALALALFAVIAE